MDAYGETVKSAIQKRACSLNALGKFVFENPELQFEEHKAHDFITNYLEQEGFLVQRNYLLETAFRAEYGRGSPVVVLLCEYDALPNIDHACGHNLIAESAVAAGIAVKEVLQQDSSLAGKSYQKSELHRWQSLSVPRRFEAAERYVTVQNADVFVISDMSAVVVVLGTPAEEAGHGKVYLIDGGAFEGADVAMMIHPAPVNIAVFPSLALARLRVEYRGKESHSGATPWEGINALDAAVGAYVNLSMLRQQMKPSWKLGATISDKDSRANVTPSVYYMEVTMRAPKSHELAELKSKVEACLNSAATATGCEVDVTMKDPIAQNVLTNTALVRVYQENAEKLGMQFPDTSRFPAMIGASTDAGNVSHILPLIHPTFSLNTKAINHTAEFADAARAQTSYELTLTAAQALSLTALEVIRDPKLLKKVKDEFEANQTQK